MISKSLLVVGLKIACGSSLKVLAQRNLKLFFVLSSLIFGKGKKADFVSGVVCHNFEERVKVYASVFVNTFVYLST